MALARHLRHAGCLTPALILRAVLCGNLILFEAAVSELAGLPIHRVAGLAGSGRGLAFQSLYAKAGLPAALRPAFAAALRQVGGCEGAAGNSLNRGRIAKVLSACLPLDAATLGSVTALLRRLDAQAARDEARTYATKLMREAPILRLPHVSQADRIAPLPSAA